MKLRPDRQDLKTHEGTAVAQHKDMESVEFAEFSRWIEEKLAELEARWEGFGPKRQSERRSR